VDIARGAEQVYKDHGCKVSIHSAHQRESTEHVQIPPPPSHSITPTSSPSTLTPSSTQSLLTPIVTSSGPTRKRSHSNMREKGKDKLSVSLSLLLYPDTWILSGNQTPPAVGRPTNTTIAALVTKGTGGDGKPTFACKFCAKLSKGNPELSRVIAHALKCKDIPSDVKADVMKVSSDRSLSSRIESLADEVEAEPVAAKSAKLSVAVFKKAGSVRKEKELELFQAKVSTHFITASTLTNDMSG
jgi:hypothetical protein